MNKVLILGYGNPLRGDDGIGWIAAFQLQDCNQDKNVIIETSHQLTPELAEQFSEFELVVLIDADAQGAPGEIKIRTVEPADLQLEPINHFSTPESILAMAKDIYGKAPKTYIASISGETFDFQETLSPKIEAQLPGLIDSIQKIIKNETADAANI